MIDLLAVIGAFAAVFVYASFFEWTMHRFLMHRPFSFFDYPFRSHTLTHHHIFNAGEGYHIQEEKHEDKVTFAWWNAPLLIGLNMPVLYLAQKASGLPFLWPGVAAMALYYTAYESFHWVMHVPRERWIEKTAAFRFLDRHHRLHHLFQYRNFNVVLPVADFLLGTLITHREQAQLKRVVVPRRVADMSVQQPAGSSEDEESLAATGEKNAF